jgi:hypothetical protein
MINTSYTGRLRVRAVRRLFDPPVYALQVEVGMRVVDGICQWEEEPPEEVVLQKEGRRWMVRSGDISAPKIKITRLDEFGDVLKEKP